MSWCLAMGGRREILGKRRGSNVRLLHGRREDKEIGREVAEVKSRIKPDVFPDAVNNYYGRCRC